MHQVNTYVEYIENFDFVSFQVLGILVELSQCYGMKQNSSRELKFTY